MSDLDDDFTRLEKIEAREEKITRLMKRVTWVILALFFITLVLSLSGCGCINADTNRSCGIIDLPAAA
jgi:hypothetical protein